MCFLGGFAAQGIFVFPSDGQWFQSVVNSSAGHYGGGDGVFGSLAPNPRASVSCCTLGSERIKFFVLRIMIAKMCCEIKMCPR